MLRGGKQRISRVSIFTLGFELFESVIRGKGGMFGGGGGI